MVYVPALYFFAKFGIAMVSIGGFFIRVTVGRIGRKIVTEKVMSNFQGPAPGVGYSHQNR